MSVFAESAHFRRILLGAIHLQTIQMAEGLVSAAWQPVRLRLARWLLLYLDRIGSPRFEVTHGFMATMIGAQRPRITEALHALEEAGALTMGRGSVTIQDAAQLRSLAAGTYGTPERAALRLQTQKTGTLL